MLQNRSLLLLLTLVLSYLAEWTTHHTQDPVDEKSRMETITQKSVNADASWGAWSGSWSPWRCYKTCGPDTQQRWRHCNTAQGEGSADVCTSGRFITRDCGHPPCSNVDASWGAWAPWSSWSNCSEKCGPETQKRWRYCNIAQGEGSTEVCKSYGGWVIRDCGHPPCCSAVDGKWSDWDSWGDCNVTCGSGKKSRERRCISDSSCGGEPCDPEDSQQTEDCRNECDVSQGTLIVAVVVSSLVTLSIGLVIALTIVLVKRKKRGTVMKVDQNYIYGLYYDVNGDPIDQRNSEVSDTNDYYG